jgi:hypothetical protein
MYRIRLTSGEEAVYRTIDELAIGVHSGVIGAEAEIFHKKSAKWLPIRLHPAFKAALEKRPGSAPALEEPLEAEADQLAPIHAASPPPFPPPLPPPPFTAEPRPKEAASGSAASPQSEVDASAAARILQMESRSGRELMLRRKDASPLLAAVAGAVALMIFLALLFHPRQPAPQPESTKPPETPSSQPPPVPLTPYEAPAEASTDSSAAIQPPLVQDTTPKPPTPDELVAHLATAQARARADFEQGLGKAGFSGVFGASRMGSGDSVRFSRHSIAAVRTLLAQYRDSRAKLDRVYEDSADHLSTSSNWPVGALTHWKSKAVPRETKDDALAADSLLGATDRLFGVLLEHEGQYDNSDSSISFNSGDAAQDYDGLRATVMRLAAADSVGHPVERAIPLTRIAAAVTAPLPPPVILRAPSAPSLDQPR